MRVAARWAIGIAVTVVGNSTISLALNLQKLAHLRASAARTASDTQPLLPERRRPSFLQSRLWWAGIALMALGECGNFLSYGFAPASLVAPLGAVSLLANVAIAPLMLHEPVGPSDVVGIMLAIVGAVCVVACAGRTGDTPLDPPALWAAVQRPDFVVYALADLTLGALLALLAHTALGARTALVDLGVCATSGAFTVLATKGVSSFLLGAHHLIDLLREPLFPVLIAVIGVTAVVQLMYLNRALEFFDARLVIPTQFVLFTVSTIVGSSILYRDFEHMGAARIAGFAAGCALTFLGVYVLSVRPEVAQRRDATDHAPLPLPAPSPQRRRSRSVTVPTLPRHERGGSRHALAAVAAIMSNPQTYLLLHGDSEYDTHSVPHTPTRHMPTTLTRERAQLLGISPGRNLLLSQDTVPFTRPRSHA